MRPFPSLFIATMALVMAAAPALAQWQWLDASGHKIYSDKAPPPSVPEKDILTDGQGRPYIPKSNQVKKSKNWSSPTYGFEEASAAPTPAATPAAAAQGKAATPAEIDAAYKAKALADAQEAERKEAEKARMAENCKALRHNLATINSGNRIATLNEKGERVVMDQAALDAERNKIQQHMRDNQCQ